MEDKLRLQVELAAVRDAHADVCRRMLSQYADGCTLRLQVELAAVRDAHADVCRRMLSQYADGCTLRSQVELAAVRDAQRGTEEELLRATGALRSIRQHTSA